MPWLKNIPSMKNGNIRNKKKIRLSLHYNRQRGWGGNKDSVNAFYQNQLLSRVFHVIQLKPSHKAGRNGPNATGDKEGQEPGMSSVLCVSLVHCLNSRTNPFKYALFEVLLSDVGDEKAHCCWFQVLPWLNTGLFSVVCCWLLGKNHRWTRGLQQSAESEQIC